MSTSHDNKVIAEVVTQAIGVSAETGQATVEESLVDQTTMVANLVAKNLRIRDSTSSTSASTATRSMITSCRCTISRHASLTSLVIST